MHVKLINVKSKIAAKDGLDKPPTTFTLYQIFFEHRTNNKTVNRVPPP